MRTWLVGDQNAEISWTKAPIRIRAAEAVIAVVTGVAVAASIAVT